MFVCVIYQICIRFFFSFLRFFRFFVVSNSLSLEPFSRQIRQLTWLILTLVTNSIQQCDSFFCMLVFSFLLLRSVHYHESLFLCVLVRSSSLYLPL